MTFAIHVIAELYEVEVLTDLDHIETTLRTAAHDAGATVLGGHFHSFDGGGVTGVLLLAESHITIHTWPELGYAALDVFMCGAMKPRLAAHRVASGLVAGRCDIREVARGPQSNQRAQPA
ncbi:MAG: adenosylmethionine decarboxylase [Paracoccaceae bacterium]|uniref:adenosylmethionine decarboxylase n=1 Tax=Rhodobacterales TaxID=204455 RepID=UPI003296A0A1